MRTSAVRPWVGNSELPMSGWGDARGPKWSLPARYERGLRVGSRRLRDQSVRLELGVQCGGVLHDLDRCLQSCTWLWCRSSLHPALLRHVRDQRYGGWREFGNAPWRRLGYATELEAGSWPPTTESSDEIGFKLGRPARRLWTTSVLRVRSGDRAQRENVKSVTGDGTPPTAR